MYKPKRIYQIARQINISHSEIVTFLKDKGLDVTNHMSPVDEETYELILMNFASDLYQQKLEQNPPLPQKKKDNFKLIGQSAQRRGPNKLAMKDLQEREGLEKMGTVINCKLCGKKFGIFRWRKECTECGKKICSDCSQRVSYLRRRVCNPCSDKIWDGIYDIKVVRSDHVGGHSISKSLGSIDGDFWERDLDESLSNIKYQAFKSGANAIVSYSYSKDTGSEPSENGKGTHHFTIFQASGEAVIIKKVEHRKSTKTKKHSEIGTELSKLSVLKDKGVLTQEEYNRAKEKLLK